MANRGFNRVQSIQKEIKHVYAKVLVGATGAPTLVTTNGASMGVASVTRDSAGVFDITLEDKYNSLVFVSVVQLEATAEDLSFQLESEDVNGTKVVKLQCKTGSVETDPSDGSTLLIKFELKNTSVK